MPPKLEAADDPKWFNRQWCYYNVLILLCQLDSSDIEIATRIGLQPGGGQFFREKRADLHKLSAILEVGERSLASSSSIQPAELSEAVQLELQLPHPAL